MKIYKVLCVDVKTHMEIIASDCSYNAACYYLENQGLINENVKVKFDPNTNRYLLIQEEGRLFIYDENRGLLLGD